MKNSLKNATIDHHYFEKQNAIHLGEVLSVWFHIKQRDLPHINIGTIEQYNSVFFIVIFIDSFVPTKFLNLQNIF